MDQKQERVMRSISRSIDAIFGERSDLSRSIDRIHRSEVGESDVIYYHEESMCYLSIRSRREIVDIILARAIDVIHQSEAERVMRSLV